METTIRSDKKTKTEAEKNWKALKLHMNTSEFKAHIHNIEEGKFESLTESKTAFYKWMKKRKK